MSLIRMAFHESGHALIARDLGRPVEVVSILSDGGGITTTAGPIAGERTQQELEEALVILHAGAAAETYAPRSPSPDASAAVNSNGGGVVPAGDDAHGPTDAEIIDRYTADLGDEVVERARALAVELIDRKSVTGALELVADRLLLAGSLTGDDLDGLLAPAP